MARINFPSNPSNGQTLTVTIGSANTIYTYNSTYSVWRSLGSGGGGASVTTSNTAPSSPSAGDLWWNSMDGNMYVYYNDGDSNQWVQSNPAQPGPAGPAGSGSGGTSVTVYSSNSAFPTTGNTRGDFAFANNTSTLYLWDGSEWDRIAAGVDESPVIITEPATSVTLAANGSPSTVTMLASDPEGFDVTYGVAYNTSGSSLPTQLSVATTVNSNGVYTFTPSANSSHGGSFKARLSASDGAKSTTRTVDFSLSFVGPTVEYLIVAGGASGGGHYGGGGGAGGLLSGNTVLNVATTYTITVGAGGASVSGYAASQYLGINGSNSVFNSITATGGGGGGHRDSTYLNGVSGGSGGGGGGGIGSSTGGAGVSGQGNAGGDGLDNGASSLGGGGGGAGGAGSSGTNGGHGGAGSSSSITGSSVTYAGGGGGGTQSATSAGSGGSGGGGAGGKDTTNGTNGTTSTGGGGGGAGQSESSSNSGAGGSGVVILRTLGTASATTGSPTVTTDGSYNIYKFTGSGSITF